MQDSNKQIEEILYKVFGKKNVDNTTSLFASPYSLKPRDILFIIYLYIIGNNLTISTMPSWDYNNVNILLLTEYCVKLQKMNSKEEKDD